VWQIPIFQIRRSVSVVFFKFLLLFLIENESVNSERIGCKTFPQRSRATRGLGLKMRGFSVKHKLPK